MTESTSSTSASGSTATTPPGMTDELRMLRRSRSDRVVAGVLGGLGRRLGIDPLILRITTVVLTVFGGAGILLYAIAWLLIPADDDPASVLDQSIGRREVRDASAVPLALGLGSVIVISSGVVVGASWNGRILLILAAVGLFLLLKRRADGTGPDTGTLWTGPEPSSYRYEPPYADEWLGQAGPAGAPPGPPPPGPPAEAPEPAASPAQASAPDPATGPEATVTPPATPDVGPEEASTDDAGRGAATGPPSTAAGAGMPPGAVTGWPDGPDWGVYDRGPSPYDELRLDAGQQPEAPVATKKHQRSVLGLLTTCAALVAVGVLAIMDEVLRLEPGPLYVAIPLGIVAVGLIVGTWFGRSRWLIFLGILLTVALIPATFVSRWDASAGPVDLVASPSVAALPTEPLTHGAGPFNYDLSALELTDADQVSITVQLGTGELHVTVPDNADIVVYSSVGAGAGDVLGESVEGIGRDSFVVDNGADGPGGGQIELNLDVGIGTLQVDRASTASEPTERPSPPGAPRARGGGSR